VFQWLNSIGGAVLLVNDVPQAMLAHADCSTIDPNVGFWLPLYSRIELYRDEIISAADGTVGII